MAKVLHLIGNFEEDKGGAQRVILNIINTCHGSNLEMGVCSLFGESTLAKALPGDVFNVNLNHTFRYNPIIFWNLYKVISEWKPDVLHIHSSVVGIFGRPIAFLLGIRQITTVHNDVKKVPLRNRLIDKCSIGLSEDIICVSNEVKKSIWSEYDRYIGQHTDVISISNCIDCKKLKKKVKIDSFSKQKQLGLVEKDYLVGTVGRLHPVKGHIYLIKAWEKVHELYPNAALVITGEGRERYRLVKLVNELNIDESVFFLGARDDVPEILNMIDLFILPSLSEGLPISLLEAMCMEKVIIASNIDPLKQSLGNTGMLVPPQDSKSLGEQIVEVLNNFENYGHLGQKAREQLVKNFSPKEFGKRYLSVYNKYI